MALDILHDNWGPYTHTEVENALKAYLAVLENRINQAIQSGGVGLADLSAEVQALLNKANTALQPENLASWAKQQNKPGYTVGEITYDNLTTLAQKLAAMDQAIQAAAQSGGTEPDTSMSDTSENAVQNKVIKAYVDAVSQRIDTLIGSGNVQGAIDTFNEVVAFLNGINSSDTLAAKLALKANDSDVVKTVSVNGQAQTKDPQTGNVNIEVQAGGESIVFDTEGTPIIDSPLSANADTVLGTASARWVKEIDNNVKAILAALAGIAFTDDKPTWQAVAKRKYSLTMSVTGCTGEVVSGDAGSGKVYEGGVRIKLTPTTAYTFSSIKVNGEDVSSTPTGDSDNSVYVDFIANQDITVAATAVSGFAIAVSGSHVTNTQSHSGSTYTVTLGSDNQHFHLPDTIVVKHGQTVLTVNTHYTYNKNTGEVVIYNVNDATYSIEVTMVEDAKYNVTLDATGLSGATASLSAEQVYAGESAAITVTPQSGYTLNSVKYAINSGSEQTATISNNQAVITISNISENKSVVVTGSASIPTTLDLNLKWFEQPSNPTIASGVPFSLELTPLTDFVAAATQDAGTENEKAIRAAVGVIMNGTDITNDTGVVTFDETNNKVTISIANPSGSVTINATARMTLLRNKRVATPSGNIADGTGLCVQKCAVPLPGNAMPLNEFWVSFCKKNLAASNFNCVFYDGGGSKVKYWTANTGLVNGVRHVENANSDNSLNDAKSFRFATALASASGDTSDVEDINNNPILPYFDVMSTDGNNTRIRVISRDDFINAYYTDS